MKKTVDDVESLMKRQEDFENTLQAQDDKVKAMDELADKLIRDGHPDKDQYVQICLKKNKDLRSDLLTKK